MFLHVDSKGSDQTWQMPRLIRVFAGCISFCFFYRAVAQFNFVSGDKSCITSNHGF